MRVRRCGGSTIWSLGILLLFAAASTANGQACGVCDSGGICDSQVGITGTEPGDDEAHLLQWLRDGRHGEMRWMAREDAVRRRLDPRAALPGSRTVVVTSMSYAPGAGPPTDHEAARPRVARYARGRDYHLEFESRLQGLSALIRARWPDAATREYVDYGPVLERSHAQRAGLGWIGKNACLIDPDCASGRCDPTTTVGDITSVAVTIV